MAGHSKWANIRIRKGAQDAKRGKAFTRAAKEIMIAARVGGDPDMNPRLRTAIAAAKAVNMPKDKIDVAIKKGTGELQADTIEEITYEGYGPGGIAIIVESATDNKNRTVAEVRHIFAKRGGNMGETGSVGWMFGRKGVFTFPKEGFEEDQLMEVGLEAGAEDVIDEGDTWEVHSAFEDFHTLQQAFDEAELKYESAQISMVPQNVMDLEADQAKKVLALVEALEENEDVQNVWSNLNLTDELMQALED